MLFKLRFWSLFLLIATKYRMHQANSLWWTHSISNSIYADVDVCLASNYYEPSQWVIGHRSTEFLQNTHTEHIDIVELYRMECVKMPNHRLYHFNFNDFVGQCGSGQDVRGQFLQTYTLHTQGEGGREISFSIIISIFTLQHFMRLSRLPCHSKPRFLSVSQALRCGFTL